MRLTLRTLLAYLDDTLDSAQVKQIGQKVAESDTAQELIARIKQVSRRRRLTTPPAGGPGTKIDPNLIGEYLDNKLSEDEVAEVEQICLGSDVHLAEVASCHQILTLVLGEPILIPPTSRQRMYGLVKGRHAIPFRKPPAEKGAEREREESYETDETLRLGLPALRRGNWTSRLVLIGGGLAACALLALVVFQALQLGDGTPKEDNGQVSTLQEKRTRERNENRDAAGQETRPNKDKTTQSGGKDKKDKTQPGSTGSSAPKKESKTGGTSGQKTGSTPPGGQPKRLPSEKPLPGAASHEVQPVGDYFQPLDPQVPALLLQYEPEKSTWRRLDALHPKVMTGLPLVSLPGFQSVVDTENVRVILWGIQPETALFHTPMLESLVELHKTDAFDLELTLLRGRIVLQNRKDKPTQVRLRFRNPSKPQKDGVWDLTLPDKGTDVLVERWSEMKPNEPFYADPKASGRVGPVAFVNLIVRKGSVEVLDHDLPLSLKAPPGNSYLAWKSAGGTPKPGPVQALPEWATGAADLAKVPEDQRKQLKEIQRKMLEAEEDLASKMAMLNPDAALSEFMKSDSWKTLLALRCYAALDDLPALIDAASIDDPNRGGIRVKALGNLWRWIAHDYENDGRLFQTLREQKFTALEAEDAMTMLHGFSPRDVEDAVTYKMAIGYLDSSKAALRQLAEMSLYFNLRSYFSDKLRDEVGAIPYSPSAPPEVRQKAQSAWNALLQQGKLPPKLKAPG